MEADADRSGEMSWRLNSLSSKEKQRFWNFGGKTHLAQVWTSFEMCSGSHGHRGQLWGSSQERSLFESRHAVG